MMAIFQKMYETKIVSIRKDSSIRFDVEEVIVKMVMWQKNHMLTSAKKSFLSNFF